MVGGVELSSRSRSIKKKWRRKKDAERREKREIKRSQRAMDQERRIELERTNSMRVRANWSWALRYSAVLRTVARLAAGE